MGINDNERDAILWSQFKNGNNESFTVIFKNYYSGLFNYGAKITADHNLVEDTIQELFLDMWRSGGKADIISLKAYIFRAFKFKLVKLIAKNNKVKNLSANPLETAFEISHENFLVLKEQNAALSKKVTAALEQLSSRQKEIIYLKFYLNLSYEEVSDIMGINYQASRNLIYQSIKVLKKIIPFNVTFMLLLSSIK
jgi:RNA polymerase sigma-70 factor (ECF subfamily)